VSPNGGLVRLQRALASTSRSLVVVLEQIQDCCQPRSDASIGLEGPWAIDNMQDDVGIGTRPQVVAALELSEALRRDVSLEDAGRDDLEPVVASRTHSAAEDVRLLLDPWQVRRMGTELQPASSTTQGWDQLFEPMLTEPTAKP
jgi:hypothetical protein